MDQAAGSQRGRAGIFHTAFDEIVNRSLRVLGPGIFHVELFGKQRNHVLGAGKSGIDFRFFAARNGVTNGHAIPGIFLLHEFAGDHGNQVSRERERLLPVPGFHAVGFGFHAEQVAIGNRDPGWRDGNQHFGSGPIVGIVVNRNVIAGIFRFALRPDFLGAIGIILVGKNEVEALFGLAVVADENFMGVAAFGGAGKLNA